MTEDGPPVDTDRDRDRAEMHQQADVGRDHSRLYRLLAWLADNALLVGGVIGLVIFAVAAVIGVDIPRNVRIIGLSGLISLVFLGRPTGKKVRSMLWDPNYIWIVDVDARVLEGGIFHMPAQRFQQWTVTEGSLDWVSPNLAFGKQVDLLEQTVEGTWRGTLSDRELMRALQAVEECRGQLEEDAKRGFAIESQAFTIVRNATRKAVFRIVETFEKGTPTKASRSPRRSTAPSNGSDSNDSFATQRPTTRPSPTCPVSRSTSNRRPTTLSTKRSRTPRRFPAMTEAVEIVLAFTLAIVVSAVWLHLWRLGYA
ncbi:hypothetical protein ACFQL1_20325 [Halomicroarcula sp. GCM10025709]|uniref:hypothetical protein n=1 Tax=Halomicroarcula sp. GCM10025709 TaxID=3252669 RepID=UPI00360D4361